MLERRRAKGVASGASRGNRNYTVARGVRDDHTALRPARLADDGPDRGRSRRGRVVPADLSHRAEDSARMVEMKWALLVLLAGPLAGQTSLSIYSDGRVVVRRTLPQALDKGRNTLTLKGVGPRHALLAGHGGRAPVGDRAAAHGSRRGVAARRGTDARVR